MLDSGPSGMMWVWLFVTAGIIMSYNVSASPILTGLTGGMANDGYQSTKAEDTYLRFKPRTRPGALDTADTVHAALLHDTKGNGVNNGAQDTQDVASNNRMQSVTDDGNIPAVPSSDGNENIYNTLTEVDGEEKPHEVDTNSKYDNDVTSAAHGDENRTSQSIGDGDVYGDQGDAADRTYQNIGDGEVYGDQETAGDLNEYDVTPRVLETQSRDKELDQGSYVTPVIDDTEDTIRKITTDDGDVTKDNHDTSGEGYSSQVKVPDEPIETESLTDYSDDSDINSAPTEAEEPVDLVDILNTLKEIVDGDDGFVVTGSISQMFVYPEGALANERSSDLGQVYSHEQTGSTGPREMSQSETDEENTNEDEDGWGYPSFQAMLNFGQVEDSDIVDLDDISENIISDVESLARPFLQIAQDVRHNEKEIAINSNGELEPREGYVYVRDLTGDTTLAIRENNGNRDSVDVPSHTLNEIAIIYSL